MRSVSNTFLELGGGGKKKHCFMRLSKNGFPKYKCDQKKKKKKWGSNKAIIYDTSK